MTSPRILEPGAGGGEAAASSHTGSARTEARGCQLPSLPLLFPLQQDPMSPPPLDISIPSLPPLNLQAQP